MAIINCPECQSEVSDTALECPKCAVKLRKPTRSNFGKLIKFSVIGFNIFMLIWFVTGMHAALVGTTMVSEAEQVGASIGIVLSTMVIFGIWALGDIVGGIFMLVTRPK